MTAIYHSMAYIRIEVFPTKNRIVLLVRRTLLSLRHNRIKQKQESIYCIVWLAVIVQQNCFGYGVSNERLDNMDKVITHAKITVKATNPIDDLTKLT